MANLGYVGVSNLSQKMTKYYVGTDITYTPVEYIESTGTQYIDTGVLTNDNLTIECELKCLGNSSDFNYSGAVYSGSQGWCAFGSYSLGKLCAYYTKTTRSGAEINFDNNWHTYYLSNGLQKVDTTTAAVSFSGIPTTLTIQLFRGNINFGDTVFSMKQQIKSCKIYDNDTLVRDFIPVLDHNNVACLLDKVSYTFYYNSGIGDFTYGTTGTQVTINNIARPVTNMYVGVANTYTPVEYIESSGTQFIDTGLKALDLITTGKIEEQAQYSNATTRQQYGYVWYSTLDTTDRLFFCPIAIYNNNWFAQFDGTNTTTLGTADTSTHTFICDLLNNKGYRDSTEYTLYNNNTGTTDGNVFLFGRNASTFTGCSKKVYYTKIYNNEVLVRDFVPVVDSDNVACLYDKVEGKAYYNIGTGTFTAGNATGESAITGSYSRKIKDNYTAEYFWSNIAPTSWSGTTTTANYEFSSSNTYGTWKVSSTSSATGTSYPSWKAVDSDNNSYLNTSGLTVLTLTLPNNVAILPKCVVFKTQYCGRVQLTGIEENTGCEFLIFEGTVTSPSSATSYNSNIKTDKYFTKFKVVELDRYSSNQVRLYAFRIDAGIVKVTGG